MIRHHAVADASYYLNAQSELDTTLDWQGKLCDSLSLAGQDVQAFRWIAKGKTPHGEKLTQRDKDNAIRFHDLTFSEPKSVSLLEQIYGDDRIAWARRESVKEVMENYVEPLAHTRETVGGKQRQVKTGKLAWIGFEHKLGRPVKGWPDPNGHIHVCVASVSEHNGKRTALEPEPIVKRLPLIEAAWNTIYARNLKQLGYEIRPTATAFEIKHVPDQTIRKFSQRSEVVEAEALRRRVKSPKAKAALGAFTREKKLQRVEPDRLAREWMGRLDTGERQILQAVLHKAARGPNRAEGIGYRPGRPKHVPRPSKREIRHP